MSKVSQHAGYRVFIAAILLLQSVGLAQAIVGGAVVAPNDIKPHVVLIVGSHGTSCTGTVIARDLVLTAAHCVMPGSTYKLVELDAERRPRLIDVASVAQHPLFELTTMLAHRATADVALLKLAMPLPPAFAPVPLSVNATIAPGATFIVVGYGVTIRGDGRSGGTLRWVQLVATGKPGPLQFRLVDPVAQGRRPGLGACTGDSGAPVFAETEGRVAIIGVVSWSTGPNASAGCGGLTGVTPLVRYRGWIAQQAATMGSRLAP